MVDATLFDGIFSGSNGVAETLLKTLGLNQGAVIKLKACEDYDPITGRTIKAPAEDFTVNASPPLVYTIDEIDGSNILQGDIHNIIGASDLKRDISTVSKERLLQSILEINGEALTIINVMPMISGTKIAGYELQLRKVE